eukprot:CAMPEP_0176154082 /NCGR_PEP_ID=MMETSP0120_2-20121206/78716_1 /TAXON_ID=160619 /ORGANISM="Kryptoperidinium foliaceum, Strain CCMP 1326" /LENGTH=75 /DNA_ID=CAMNT_0017491165 /DNA_START=200 /DNA_END=423 /DNA_ORIENTATION=+
MDELLLIQLAGRLLPPEHLHRKLKFVWPQAPISIDVRGIENLLRTSSRSYNKLALRGRLAVSTSVNKRHMYLTSS